MATLTSSSPNPNPNFNHNQTLSENPSESDQDHPFSDLPDPPFSSPTQPDPTRTLEETPKLIHLSFNQDHGCFAIGTDKGFRVHNCDPFREIFRRDFGSGIGTVEMLYRCNILALAGGGPDPMYPVNKVMIWDDHQNSFADLKLLHQIETVANPKGLCEVSHVSGSIVLVCPGLQNGQVRIEHYGLKRSKFITAHDSSVVCFAMMQDGRFLATASSKGTLVRVFNTLDGSLLQEVRRGADRAEIYSLAFSSHAQWLAVSSDKGTIHVFGLKVESGSLATDTSRIASSTTLSTLSAISSLSLIKGVLPKYFSSEWSVAQYRLQEGIQYITAFGHQKNTVVILGMDGSFYKCEFDPVNGGEMKQLECHNFLKPEET